MQQFAIEAYKKHLAKALAERNNANLTSAEKAKLTKKIKRLQQQLQQQ